MRLRLAATVSTLILHAVPSLGAQHPDRRSAADSIWRVIWTVGNEKNSETFVEPRKVVVSSDRVFVLDLGTREVRGFDAASGAQRLLMTARGVGPGEFKRPALMTSTPTGFAILDHAAARLTGYSRSGKPEWDFVVPDVFGASDFCIRDQGHVLASYRRRDSSLVEFDTSGRRLSVQSVAWRVKRDTKIPFAHDAQFSASSTRRECALAPYFGREWAVVGAANAPAPRVLDYIEAGDEPIMHTTEKVVERQLDKVALKSVETSTTNGVVKGALIRGDTVILVGAHTKAFPHRLLDYYDSRNGKYLYSRTLPFTVIALAIGTDGTFYATVIDAKVQALVAFRPERISKEYLDRVKKATAARADTSARRRPPAPVPPRGFP